MNFLKSLAALAVGGCATPFDREKWIAQATAELKRLAADNVDGHNFQREIEVKGSITETLMKITDASPKNRYLVVVPPGEYREALNFELWKNVHDVMLMGTRDKTLILWERDDVDTIRMGGTNVALVSLSIMHRTKSGTPRYPVHADYDSGHGGDWMIYDCVLNGQSRKSGLGIGMHGGERGRVVKSMITGDRTKGVNAHNNNGKQSAPSQLFFANCHLEALGDGPETVGIGYYNMGTKQPDIVAFAGGTYIGKAGGIEVENRKDGAAESFVLMDEAALRANRSLVDPAKLIKV